MARDFWLNKRPVIETRKINKKLIIPAFSYNSFWARRSLEATASITASCGFALNRDMSSDFTLDFWFKTFSADNSSKSILRNHALVSDFEQLFIRLENKSLYIDVQKDASVDTLKSDDNIAINEWVHITVTYDGSTIKLYVNGKKQATEHIVASPLDQDGTGNYALIGALDNSSLNPFTGLYGPIRAWNFAADQFQVTRLFKGPSFVTETGLLMYYPFRQLTNTGIVIRATNEVTGIAGVIASANTGYSVETSDLAPQSLGSSYAVARSVISLDYPVSLLFPAKPPADHNFGLIVSWEDSEGNIQRRSVFSVDGLINRPAFSPYRGEKLPIPFELEIWNIDGNPTVNLAEDYTLYISKTTHPLTNIDHESQLEVSTILDNTLAESYALTTFPLVFNTQQTF
jgi:hypothetical protein